MKPLTGPEVVKLLKKQGWELKRIRGSHYIFLKEGHDAVISVPVHGKRVLKLGVQHGILKDAGITWEEVEELLR